jgi:hypothetical protein
MTDASKLDATHLLKVTEAAKILCQSLPKQMIAVKDLNSIHLFFSDYIAEFFQIKPDDIEGAKFFAPIYIEDPHFKQTIDDEDAWVIKNRQERVVLRVQHNLEELRPYACKKLPIINPETNNVVGVYVQGIELLHINFSRFPQKLFDYEDAFAERKDLPKLTRREKQVVFFFMANLSSQEIADVLGKIENKSLSKKTIDAVFSDQLYAKFAVYSRVGLYQKLLNLRYDELIPKELLTLSSFSISSIRSY